MKNLLWYIFTIVMIILIFISPSNITMYIGISLLILGFALIILKPKPKPLEIKPIMYTHIKCIKCDYKRKRPFKRGDYVNKEVVEGYDVHLTESCLVCDGKLIIDGIYYEKPKTKADIEYEKLVEEWR